MRPKLAFILLLIVVLPTTVLMALGTRIARHEQSGTRQRYENLLQERLGDVDGGIARLLRERERQMQLALELSEISPGSLRSISRSSPYMLQAFALDAKGLIIHPAPGGDLTAREWDFLERAQDILVSKDLLLQATATDESSLPAATHGWYRWFWGQDIRLLFWTRDQQGLILGAELDVVRLLADIIAEMPETAAASDSGSVAGSRSRIRLLDSRGETLYQWGSFEPAPAASPIVSRSLGEPLAAWALDYHLPEALLANQGRGTLMAILGGTLALGLLLTALAIYFYQASSRELRQASERVSFVNRVSHELKTPLTNIRMYAELLSAHHIETDSKTQGHLDVIVSESQRLSRLIGNILSFGRKQRQQLTLHPSAGVVDAVIRAVLEHSKPGLEAAGLKVTFAADAAGEVIFDADALEQILGNLLSNVEKYAAAGEAVVVTSSQAEGRTLITVSDAGPGIPAADRERIFRPFFRVSNRLTDGIAGTGIGLSIARDLARLHGGDLVLLDQARGALFSLSLATPSGETQVAP